MLAVMIGGGCGAVCRFLLGKWLLNFTRTPLPTFLINSIGSFLLGVVLQLELHETLQLLLATGFLGGFTTFSTYSYEALQLMLAGKKLQALFYVLGSVICAVASLWLATLIV